MEVKVGQVWLDDHDNEFVVDSCSNDMAMAKYAEFDTTIPLSKSFIVSSCSRIYESEPQLSDLEIVQKALEMSALVDDRPASLDLLAYGRWIVWNYKETSAHQLANGDDLESLLTWAKQTVGQQ